MSSGMGRGFVECTHVVPGHPRGIKHADGAVRVRADILLNRQTSSESAEVTSSHLEVKYARVIVILAREEGICKVGGVHVGERVRLGVPASEAEVQPADAGAVIIHDDDFLVMRPELYTV